MKKIVILGPESTGKSTLCSHLAAHYQTSWCPEYAREYLMNLNGTYSYEDLLQIAKGQITLEEKLEKDAKNGVYFIDTDMYVMKVWCEVAFGNCHNWILKQIAVRKYDLYLLCDTDLPWKQDALREYPDQAFRNRLLKMYRDILVNAGVPWVLISGLDAQRLLMATEAVDSLLYPIG
ncbi:MAG: AAA family ATPase [Flavisolibacter sp.]